MLLISGSWEPIGRVGDGEHGKMDCLGLVAFIFFCCP